MVEKYRLSRDHIADCYCEIEPGIGGSYVLASDYDALAARLAGAEAKAARLQTAFTHAADRADNLRARLAEAERLLREARGHLDNLGDKPLLKRSIDAFLRPADSAPAVLTGSQKLAAAGYKRRPSLPKDWTSEDEAADSATVDCDHCHKTFAGPVFCCEQSDCPHAANRVIGGAEACLHESYVLNGVKPGWACQKCGEPLRATPTAPAASANLRPCKDCGAFDGHYSDCTGATVTEEQK